MTTRVKNVATLIAAYRAAKAGQSIATGLRDDSSWSAERFITWFRNCLEDKINARNPRFPTGRKAGWEYQTELMRMRRYVGNRIIIDWIAPCLGSRVKAAMSDRMRERD